MQQRRSVGLDVVRACAIFFVLLTHMFAYTDVLMVDIGSFRWHIYNVIHYLSRICVPLFLLLTGYLQAGRKNDKKHWVSIVSVVFSYLLISAGVVLLDCVFIKGGISAGNVARGIRSMLSFELGYGWYVEMYLCLFALIPFLNILLGNLDKKGHKTLIGILAAITLLPSFIKGFLVFDEAVDVIPDFLENMYVVTYYCIGVYIKKYRPSINKVWCAVIAIVVLVAEDVVCAIFSSGGYAWWLFNAHSSISHTVVAVCVFLLFYDVDIKNKAVAFAFREISVCSFEMYLISYATDYLLYGHLGFDATVAIVQNFVLVYLAARIYRLGAVPVVKFIVKGLLRPKAAEAKNEPAGVI